MKWRTYFRYVSGCVVIAYILLAGAVAMFGLAGLMTFRMLAQQRDWLETDAEILESSVEGFTDPAKGKLYRGVYSIRYSAARNVREALVRSRCGVSSREEAARKVAALGPGKRMRIHVNNNAPSQADTTLPQSKEAMARVRGIGLVGLGLLLIAASILYISRGVEW